MAYKGEEAKCKLVLDLMDAAHRLPEDKILKVLRYTQDPLKGHEHAEKVSEMKLSVSNSEVTSFFPSSLEPYNDIPAVNVQSGRKIADIRPDIHYARGWEKSSTGFYFPVMGELGRKDLFRVLAALRLWDPLKDKLADMKFRSGVLFKTPEHCTPEQLEELRDAAYVLLFGYKGFHIHRGHGVLESIASAVAFYSEYSRVLTGFLNETTPGLIGKYFADEKTVDELWSHLTFCKRPCAGSQYRPLYRVNNGLPGWEPCYNVSIQK